MSLSDMFGLDFNKNPEGWKALVEFHQKYGDETVITSDDTVIFRAQGRKFTLSSCQSPMDKKPLFRITLDGQYPTDVSSVVSPWMASTDLCLDWAVKWRAYSEI